MQRLKALPSAIQNIKKIQFPQRFKGTILEKWADYWKNLYIDYKQMVQDIRTDVQEEPKKALIWCAGIVTMYNLAKNNPNEYDFKDELKNITNEIALVSDECVNTKSIEHLRNLEVYYNQGVINYQSLGVISFMYVTNYDSKCDLYKSQCKYLQPSYLNYATKIVDIGFLGRWWNLYIKTTNYDIIQ